MKKRVKLSYIWLAVACLAACVVLLFAGFLKHWLFFAAAALAAAGYVLIDRRFLGCPKCRAFINIDRLLYAKTHEFHCHHCGERIEIE